MNELYDGQRDCPWYKIKVIQKILHLYDYIIWIDSDGFIMKDNNFIQDCINKYPKDIIIQEDPNYIMNTGFMIIKNTPFVHALLYLIWNNPYPYDFSFHEQASLGKLYKENKLNCKSKIQILKHGSFFHYWREYDPDSTFFLHIARCSSDRYNFIRSMDIFCPVRMDEDTEQEYNTRVSWLNNRDLCMKDIKACANKKQDLSISTRAKKYKDSMMRN
jgi:hypothetical protein